MLRTIRLSGPQAKAFASMVCGRMTSGRLLELVLSYCANRPIESFRNKLFCGGVELRFSNSFIRRLLRPERVIYIMYVRKDDAYNFFNMALAA